MLILGGSRCRAPNMFGAVLGRLSHYRFLPLATTWISSSTALHLKAPLTSRDKRFQKVAGLIEVRMV